MLDPDDVEVRRDNQGRVLYDVKDRIGHVIDTFDWFNVLHIPSFCKPGRLRGISPIRAMADTSGSGMAL